MSKVYSLYSRQHVPASLEEVWTFFSDAKNLLAVTPPQLNLKVTNEVYGQTVYAGQVMTYKVKPLLGLPLSWMTEITHVEEKKYFVDEQRKGPYKLWHHQHHFRAVEGGVEMTDIVHYRLPFGPLGNFAHRLLVKKELQKIFAYRYQKIVELFGRWEGERKVVSIR
jgi:ligand-binding SRPBCC domain-containing protein